MAVLLELVKYQGDVVPKTHLVESVRVGVFVCEDVVTNAISMLCRALVDDAKYPALIQTISKRRYRLLSPALQRSTAPTRSIGARHRMIWPDLFSEPGIYGTKKRWRG